MRAEIVELWPWTRISVVLLYAILCIITHTRWKLKVVYTFYLSNNCSTMGDIYSLGYRCMQNMIGELQIQTRIAITFQYGILCALTVVTWKQQVICECSTYQTTALVSEMSIFCVRVGCKIQNVSYTSNMHCSIFPVSHLCLYSCT